MISLLKKYWAHPLAKDIDIDSPQTISIHRKIILKKPIMRAVYRKWYKRFLPAVSATSQLRLPMVEIGCGASHLEQYIPTVIKTDVVNHGNVHQVVDGTELPYADDSVRCLFVLNALHHFDFPQKFLAEAERVLAPGGRLVLTEPSNSPLQKFMIRHFHLHEYYDDSVKRWDNVVEGRLSSANNALPWIIFQRDRTLFETRFPKLKILSIKRHTLFFYFASGGLSYRSFLPALSIPFLHLSEWLVTLIPLLGTEMTIEIEKSPEVRLADSAKSKATQNQHKSPETGLDA